MTHSVVGHSSSETHAHVADVTKAGGGHSSSETHADAAAPDLLSLRVFAEVFDDLQKTRIATVNRVRRSNADVRFFEAALERLKSSEEEAHLSLVRCYRDTTPDDIQRWQNDNAGIGEHLLARLLGVVGHPVYTTAHAWEGSGPDRKLIEIGPLCRSVSQLWSYCGHGDPARKRAKGMTAEQAAMMGNPRAKMLTRLLAESCMKCAGGVNKNGKPRPLSPYRVVYDEARASYEAREWTDLHRHNAALRKAGKAILKDLWIAAGGAIRVTYTQSAAAPSDSSDAGAPPMLDPKPGQSPAVSP